VAIEQPLKSPSTFKNLDGELQLSEEILGLQDAGLGATDLSLWLLECSNQNSEVEAREGGGGQYGVLSC
jgi:hypothetical protein